MPTSISLVARLHALLVRVASPSPLTPRRDNLTRSSSSSRKLGKVTVAVGVMLFFFSPNPSSATKQVRPRKSLERSSPAKGSARLIPMLGGVAVDAIVSSNWRHHSRSVALRRPRISSNCWTLYPSSSCRLEPDVQVVDSSIAARYDIPPTVPLPDLSITSGMRIPVFPHLSCSAGHPQHRRF